jgi:receptor protein-tyrosine kinase
MSKPASAVKSQPGSNPETSRSIGTILVQQGRIKAPDIDRIQHHALERGIRFGEAAIELELLTSDDIKAALERQFSQVVFGRGGVGGVADDVIAAYDPQSPLVEPLRILRSQLLFNWPEQLERKIIMITSPDRGEGRSWLAANLAVTFSQMGHRTLLIDADMHRPRQHILFGLDNTLGLSALLTGRAGAAAIPSVGAQSSLSVLTAGVPPPNPQELLARPSFEWAIDLLSAQHDVILIDTPPAADTSDALLIAAQARAALVIGRRDFTKHARLNAALHHFKMAGIVILGCVLNEY